MPVLFLIVVVDLIGFGIIIPLLPFYAEHFQASPTTVGLLMATFSAAQFVAAPYLGQLSDRVGRRPVLLLSLAGAAISYLGLAFADTLAMLFAMRAVGGFMAGNISTAFAYVADVTTKENRAKGMGLIGAAFGIGFILGPAVGGLLAGNDPAKADFMTPSLAAAALSSLALILTILFLKESLPPETRRALAAQSRQSRWQSLRTSLQMPGVGLLIFLAFLATFVFAGLESTFAMWSRRQFGWGPAQNGYLFAFIGVLGALIQGGAVGKLAKRFGEERLIVSGALMLAIGIGCIPLSETVPMLVAAMAVAGVGFSLISPALNSAISVRGGDGVQGGLMGVTRSATTFSRMVGPAAGGLMFGVIGKDAPYFAGAALMLVVAALAIRGLATRKGRIASADSEA